MAIKIRDDLDLGTNEVLNANLGTIDQHSDVDLTGIVINDTLIWDGSLFLPGAGGGGGGTLQDAYDGGSNILINANEPVQIRNNGIAYGASPVGMLIDVNTAFNLSQLLIAPNPVNGSPTAVQTVEILADSVVTISSATTITFGTDLRALPYPVAVAGDTTFFLSGTLVILKDSDVPADEGVYLIASLDGTGTITTLTNFDGTPATLAGTTGTVKLANYTRLDSASNETGGGGVGHANALLPGMGDSSFFLNADLNDGGSVNAIKVMFNTGDVAATMLGILNFGPLAGATADVPFITMSAPVVPNATDLAFISNRTTDPTTISAGNLWYNNSVNSGITGRFKYRDSGATTRTLATLDDITGGGGTLQDAYDASATPADITLSAGKNIRIINTASEGLVIRNAADTADVFKTNNSGHGLYAQSQTSGLATLTLDQPTGGVSAQLRFINGALLGASATEGDFNYDISTDRLYIGISAGVEKVIAYRDDLFYTIGTGGDYATVAAALTAITDSSYKLIIISNVTEVSTLVTLTSSKSITILIRHGITWDSANLTIRSTNGTARLQLTIEGEVPSIFAPSTYFSQWSVSKTSGTGADGFFSVDGAANNDASFTVRNLKVVNTSTLAMPDGLAVVSNIYLENFVWSCSNSGSSNHELEGYLVIKNGEFAGTGSDSRICRIVGGYIEDIRITGVFITGGTYAIEVDSSPTTIRNIWIAAATNYITIGTSSNTVKFENFLSADGLAHVLSIGPDSNLININMPSASIFCGSTGVVVSGGYIDSVSFAGNSKYSNVTLGTSTTTSLVSNSGVEFYGCTFSNGVTVDSNSHHNHFIAPIVSASGIIIDGDYNQISGGRIGPIGGGTGDTITLSGTAVSNIILGTHVDSAISDSGTGTQLLANVVY